MSDSLTLKKKDVKKLMKNIYPQVVVVSESESSIQGVVKISKILKIFVMFVVKLTILSEISYNHMNIHTFSYLQKTFTPFL